LDSLLAMEDLVANRILDSWCPYRFLPSVKEEDEKKRKVPPFRPFLLMRKRSGGFDAWCRSMREISLEKLRAEQRRHKVSENLYEEEMALDSSLSPAQLPLTQRPPSSPHKLAPQQPKKQSPPQPQPQTQIPTQQPSKQGGMMYFMSGSSAPANPRQKQQQMGFGMHSPIYASPGNIAYPPPSGAMYYDSMEQQQQQQANTQKRHSGGFPGGAGVGMGMYDTLSPTEQAYMHSPQVQHQFLQQDYSPQQIRPRSGSGHDSFPDTIIGPNSNARNTGDAYSRRTQQAQFLDQQSASLWRRPSSGIPTRTTSSSAGYYLGVQY